MAVKNGAVVTDFYLKVKKLTHAYGSCLIFSETSFDLVAGCVLQVTGRNGSGKSTLLQLLAGIKTCQTGSVHRNEGTHFIYIGHRNAVKAELSPLENLGLYEPSASARAEALEKMGLEKSHHHRPCYMLSAGQQRKVALSRLLLTEAKVWLLDEPFTALDDVTRAQVTSYLERHAKNGGSAVVATHDRLEMDKSVLREMVMS